MKHSENLQIFGGIWHSHLTLLLFDLAETEDSERSFGERSLFLFLGLSFPEEVGEADHRLECSHTKAGCLGQAWPEADSS